MARPFGTGKKTEKLIEQLSTTNMSASAFAKKHRVSRQYIHQLLENHIRYGPKIVLDKNSEV